MIRLWCLWLAWCAALASADPAMSAGSWKEREPALLKELQDYLKINTVNPPGNVRDAVKYLKALMDREGIETKIYEADPLGGKVNLVGRLRAAQPGGKSVLLLNHMDVVPVEPARWSADPFAAEVKAVPLAGRNAMTPQLYGRGALDMKGMAMLELNALILLKRLNLPLTRDVVILCAADEETGGAHGAEWMVNQHFADLDPGVVINEGGEGSIGVLTDEMKPIYGVQVGEKQVLWMKWWVEGKGGHASIPLKENASERLVAGLQDALKWVKGLRPPPPAVLQLLKLRLGKMKDAPLAYAIQHQTMSLTSLTSGVGVPPKINVIPGRAEATVDVRLLPGTDRRAFLKELRARMGPYGIQIEVVQESIDADASPVDGPDWRAIEQGIRAVEPSSHVPIVPLISSGATDSRFFRAKGIPCYGIVPMILPEEISSTMHNHDERIPVDEFYKAARILFEIVRRLAVSEAK